MLKNYAIAEVCGYRRGKHAGGFMYLGKTPPRAYEKRRPTASLFHAPGSVQSHVQAWACFLAALMKSRNRGCAAMGRDLNSG